jgi:hypothetical protein
MSSSDYMLLSARIDFSSGDRVASDILRVAGSGHQERQEDFEAKVEHLVAEIDAAILESKNLEPVDVQLSISLIPEGGQCGIVLAPELLRRLVDARVTVFIDSLC